MVADPGSRAGPLPVLRGGRIRAAARIAAIAVWSAVLTLLWTVVHVLLLPFPRSRVRWRHRVVGTWARGFAAVLGIRRTVIGTPPRAPYFLVSNHLSYVDIILLYTCLDGVFIAKSDMRRWPVLGPLANLFGTVWVNREVRRDAVRVLDLIEEAIQRGDGVILFAEGTTSSGQALLPMRPALFDWAARKQFPVHYAALTYRTAPGAPPAHMAVGWWGEMPFGPHLLNLCRIRGFEAIVEFGPAPLPGGTRGELAEQAARAIAKRFVPVWRNDFPMG
jgi:1-acyl-sn-glycerol-3-phosphate acyltransferase